MAVTTTSQEQAREKFDAGATLSDLDAKALQSGLATDGERAWKRHQAKQKLTKREEAWLATYVLVRGRAGKRKQFHKEPLTEEERAVVREYDRRGKAARVANLYYPTPDAKRRHERLAEEEGYKKFNAWVLAKLDVAINGELVDPDHLELLKGRVAELEERERSAVARSEEYRLRAEEAESKVQELHELFVNLCERLVQDGKGRMVQGLVA